MRFVAVVLLVGSLTGLTSADVFNMGGTRNSVTGQWTGNASLEFVTVGDPGNTADTHGMEDTNTAGCGAVPYTYQMGKYDVTCAQYCKLLNAVAKNDAYGLYDPNMANPASSGSSLVGCGITRSGSPGNYTYSVTKDPNFPANYITWCDAARFCNWLSKGQPTGPEGPGTTETGSYTLNGETSHDPALMAVTRNPGARYVIPGDDEWFKAAYYKGGGTNAGYWLYPARSDTGPSSDLSSTGTNNANCWNSEGGYLTDPANYLTAVGAFAGSPGPYGTFDMGGDLWQWNEAVLHAGQFRGLRGGYFGGSNDYQILACRWSQDPSGVDYDVRIGFRVALVPEPATLSLLVLGGLLIARRRPA